MEVRAKFILVQFFEIYAYGKFSKSSWKMNIMNKPYFGFKLFGTKMIFKI